MKKVYLIGLSGHVLVAQDILSKGGFRVEGYFELEEKVEK